MTPKKKRKQSRKRSKWSKSDIIALTALIIQVLIWIIDHFL